MWDELLAGNERFATDATTTPNRDPHRREEIRGGQDPIAVVIACSDSRVPVELLFDAGFGDIFVIRTAGGCVDAAVSASVEYACLLYTSPSPRDAHESRMPSSA